MFCIPWFITLFAKIIPKAPSVLAFWDMLAQKNDPAYIFFFAVALVIQNQNKILSTVDFELPEAMVSINISDD